MAMTGKYELVSYENYEPFMKFFGLPDELIQKIKNSKNFYEIAQNGKHFKLTATTGDDVQHNEFTIGEEAEIQILTGEKFKTVAQLEGDNKLILNLKGIKSITELSGDTLTNKVGTATGRVQQSQLAMPLTGSSTTSSSLDMGHSIDGSQQSQVRPSTSQQRLQPILGGFTLGGFPG
ncbi:fatty acid-binding protein 1, liver-like [Bombina bombina]|uniref:fatty acid-binding protein 1, liver-like n=1 Tax=Bombina bombina TaxID=8345 RepID=UPI00235AC5E9|nr:fatty acid-binding protein 1, liver-like [Bombina bombina]